MSCQTENDEAFKNAIKTGNKQIVLEMLNAGQSPDTLYPSPPIIKKMTGKYNIAKSVLFLAINEHHTEVALLLLEYGANPNAVTPYGETPLFWAAKNDDIDVAKMLLKKRASLKVLNGNGYSILHVASFAKGNKCLRLFLSRDKTFLNHKNKFGKTPLMAAQEGGNTEGVQILLESGANSNEKKGL